MIKYLSLLLLIVAAIASKAPVPTCNSPSVVLNDLPISLAQTQTFNLNNLFSGYNLDFSIPTKPGDHVNLRQKAVLLNSVKWSQPGLKSYHLQHPGNGWGKNIVTLSADDNGMTTIRWGSVSANSTELPLPTKSLVLTKDPSISCFDTIWLQQQGLIMVDCLKATRNQNKTQPQLQNIFHYVNISDNNILGPVKNDLFVPFTSITHRKIRLITQPDGMRYLIRANYAQRVDAKYNHNTYVDILSLANPMKPWTMRVIDRSFLHQDKLSITDFMIYNGDIYILDYFSGVIRLSLTPAQSIIVDARYRTDSGFTRMGVYSSNLVNQFLIVLAHDHAIWEIDWTNTVQPTIVTKYSIPDGSNIHSLWVNELYVAVQLSANLTSDNGTVPTQSTYVFTRGTRTYTNAYLAIPHPNSHAYVDLDRDNNKLMSMDQDTIMVHLLQIPTVKIFPLDPKLLNTQFSFVIKAQSKNEYKPSQSTVCVFTMKFLVVPNDSLAIWPTGFKLPQSYYANYPGQLFIPLDRYVLGSNLTYGIQIDPKTDPPQNYILHQNSTHISWWDKQPSLFKYTFLRQQQYDSRDETQLFLYTQDYDNSTHFSRCITIPYTVQVHCIEAGKAPHINFRIANLTANRFEYYNGKFLHLAAILYEALPNQVFIYDVQNWAQLGTRPIMFPQGFQGKIQSIQFLGRYLAVVLRYVKQIAIFDMVQCFDHQQRQCQQVYRIDSVMLSRIGVDYFSPMDVYTSDYHPSVLFVQCLDRVLILDITRQGPILIEQVRSPGTAQMGFYKWKMAIAAGQLLIINPPDIIQQFSLDELYTYKNANATKVFPTFHYKIQDKFQVDFSDSGNLVYITAIDPKMPAGVNSVILVYRTGLPAVSSLYDVFHINGRYDDMLIDATGSFGDYVAVGLGSVLMMFRQYQIPIVVFEDSFGDYKFNITFSNDPQMRYYYVSRSEVKIANYPEDIVVNDTRLNTSDYLSSQLNYNKSKQRIPLDDYHWFNGSVLNYTLLDCPECNGKFSVINHVNKERTLLGQNDMQDYVFSNDGGYIQQYQSIIKMFHNGSINQFIQFPSVLDGQSCTLVERSVWYDYTISACKQGRQVYLYQTTYTGSKPFVIGPFPSSAKHVTSMSVQQDLLVLVDVDPTPWRFDRQGGVIIYAINHDPFQPQIFDQLQFLDTSDLSAAHGWKDEDGPIYIANAHFAFTNQSDTYRLMITQLTRGMFVVDFKWTPGRKSIQILKLQFLNLKEELVKRNLPLPNNCYFTAIGLNRFYYDSTFNYWQLQAVVVTTNFHSFQVDMHIDKTGTVVSHQISKVYYRYGFYQNQNYLKCFDGYFAVAQRLPTLLEPFQEYSPEVLVVYDTREHYSFNQTEEVEKKYFAGTNIGVEYMLGGWGFHRKGDVRFDWNWTFTRDRKNPITGIGLVAVHSREAKIRQFSVNQKLQVVLDQGITRNQNARLRAQNDFHKLDINVTLRVPGGDDDDIPGWAIALIVIAVVAVAVVGGYVVFVKFKKGKGVAYRESETEKSLLEREGEFEEKEDDDEEQSDQDEDEESGEEEEEDVRPAESPKVDAPASVAAPVEVPVVQAEQPAVAAQGGEKAADE